MRIIVLFFFFIPLLLFGQKEDSTQFEKFQFIDLNGYYDTRELRVFTLNAKIDFSPRFSYFTVSNFFSDPFKRDMNAYYMEHHLFFRITPNSPLDLTQYWISISGPKNDHLRYGIRWRMHDTQKFRSFFKRLNFSGTMGLYPLSFCEIHDPEFLGQAQYVYRIKILDRLLPNRLYIGGFANQYFDIQAADFDFSWVTEHQLGFRFWKGLHAVMEYRFNEFWPDQKGWGFGLEYFHQL
ncbi:MAG: hypothetical protein N4A41_13875 [Crocinitomicaceae bacterium]|jgi:hypothetical protein|nr:hypothetical protein [Crocinitomicaceae bacterium]